MFGRDDVKRLYSGGMGFISARTESAVIYSQSGISPAKWTGTEAWKKGLRFEL